MGILQVETRSKGAFGARVLRPASSSEPASKPASGARGLPKGSQYLERGLHLPHLLQLDLSRNELLGLVSQRFPKWEIRKPTNLFHIPGVYSQGSSIIVKGNKTQSMLKAKHNFSHLHFHLNTIWNLGHNNYCKIR